MMTFSSQAPASDMRAEPLAGSTAVIMRTRDRLLLLPRALSSVLSQKSRNWHLYLVNDGGDAPALEALLTPYRVLFDGRLTVIHHATSQGMEAASNAALARVREDYVVVHDDDDSWHPEFITATAGFLSDPRNASYAGVTSGCVVIKERIAGDQVFQVLREDWKGGRQSIVDFGDMLWENQFPPICLLFRSRLVAEIGSFDAALPVLGDWDYSLKILTQGDIGHVPRRLAYYHQRLVGTNSAYSNTTTDHNDRHERQNILLRNRHLRETFEREPHLFGQTQAIAHLLRKEALAREWHAEAMAARLNRIEEMVFSIRNEIAELDRKQRRTLESVSVFGALFRPLRRLFRRK